MTSPNPFYAAMDALGNARSALYMPPSPNGEESLLMALADHNVGRADFQIILAQRAMVVMEQKAKEIRSRVIEWADKKGMSENDLSELLTILRG